MIYFIISLVAQRVRAKKAQFPTTMKRVSLPANLMARETIAIELDIPRRTNMVFHGTKETPFLLTR